MSEAKPRLTPPPRVEDNLRATRASGRSAMVAGAFVLIAVASAGLVILRWQGGGRGETALVGGEVAGRSEVRAEVEPKPEPRPEPELEPAFEPESGSDAEAAISATGGVESGRAARKPGELEGAMSEALRGMAAKDLEAAAAALDRAEAAEPGSTAVAEARARLEELHRAARLERALGQAQVAESAEDWAAAAAAWNDALVLEPAHARARVGREVAIVRGRIAARIDAHLARPERLAADEVLAEAMALADQAAELTPRGPRLAAQLEALRTALARAATRVPVQLRSDGQTDVRLQHRASLGRFTEHRLELRPGRYTAIGSRAGHRDVRIAFTVEPGTAPVTVTVVCAERL